MIPCNPLRRCRREWTSLPRWPSPQIGRAWRQRPRACTCHSPSPSRSRCWRLADIECSGNLIFMIYEKLDKAFITCYHDDLSIQFGWIVRPLHGCNFEAFDHSECNSGIHLQIKLMRKCCDGTKLPTERSRRNHRQWRQDLGSRVGCGGLRQGGAELRRKRPRLGASAHRCCQRIPRAVTRRKPIISNCIPFHNRVQREHCIYSTKSKHMIHVSCRNSLIYHWHVYFIKSSPVNHVNVTCFLCNFTISSCNPIFAPLNHDTFFSWFHFHFKQM